MTPFTPASPDSASAGDDLFSTRWEGDICIIEMNDPSKPVNSFSIPALEQLNKILDATFARSELGGIVFTSTKPNMFAAGVDLSIFDTFKGKEDAAAAASTLQNLFHRFHTSKVPTVAAIHGTCLGGALELALACHFRIASAHPATQLGLPEVQLGLLPGGGGTQRLPRLIGIAAALDLILTGKKVDGKKAFKLGIVDDVVPENQLISKAIAWAASRKEEVKRATSAGGLYNAPPPPAVQGKQLSEDMQKLALEGTFVGRMLIEKKSKETIEKNTKGFYPAPFKALTSVMRGIHIDLLEGLKQEAALFGELAVTDVSKSLIHVFHLMTASKKNPCPPEARAAAEFSFMTPLREGRATVGVVGAGLMGSGISTVLSEKNIRSVLLDRDSASVQRGAKAVAAHFDGRVKKKRMKRFERDAALSRVLPTTDHAALISSPIIIEAVFEDVTVKHEVLKRCEGMHGDKPFLFASNTSSLPIGRIAAAARHPEHVIGMHFFSPVPKMPLVELIVTEKTAPAALSAAFDLGTAMGKQVLVVKDGPGFYTTRILAFQITEATEMLREGASIEDIDKAMEAFGMPVGPITLLDEVGIDVGAHILDVLSETFADRLKVPTEMGPILAEDRKGRKNGKGLYLYADGKKQGADASVYKHFQGLERKRFDRQDIIDRCTFVFLNEAARCLDEGILKSADDGDLGAIFGLGFPPFLGGPFHYARSLGHTAVKAKLDELAAKHGPRFRPAAYWSK